MKIQENYEGGVGGGGGGVLEDKTVQDAVPSRWCVAVAGAGAGWGHRCCAP